jgi:hypothetical protein
MTWINTESRQPKHGQWIVVPWGDGFKAGQFDKKHPFAPCIVDREAGKFYRNIQQWKPLTMPKVRP